jgi:hypothetical protein
MARDTKPVTRQRRAPRAGVRDFVVSVRRGSWSIGAVLRSTNPTTKEEDIV